MGRVSAVPQSGGSGLGAGRAVRRLGSPADPLKRARLCTGGQGECGRHGQGPAALGGSAGVEKEAGRGL